MQHKIATHGHKYICYKYATSEVLEHEKLPPILKILREETNYTFKIPHGNRVRTKILEEGECIIYNDNGLIMYRITVDRW